MGMQEPNRCRGFAKVDGRIDRCSNDAKWTEMSTIFEPWWGFCDDCKRTRSSEPSAVTWMPGRHPQAKDDLRIQP